MQRAGAAKALRRQQDVDIGKAPRGGLAADTSQRNFCALTTRAPGTWRRRAAIGAIPHRTSPPARAIGRRPCSVAFEIVMR